MSVSKAQSAKTTTSTEDPVISPSEEEIHPLVYEQRCSDLWMALIVFRCINALFVSTFFQPDEYFQSLEPAWQMAFGPQSGAWITWEWQHQLRSSLHPALFAAIYWIGDKSLDMISCFPQFRAMILSVLPNFAQALFAGAGDYYTWQLAERIYGKGSNAGWAAVLMTVFSPWQWFCSTRTFSNCMEMTLTIAALNYWPWEVSIDLTPVPDVKLIDTKKKTATSSSPTKTDVFQSAESSSSPSPASQTASTSANGHSHRINGSTSTSTKTSPSSTAATTGTTT
ncbi:hypothetical protein G7Y89_g7814 [Cudoniella acicularis]|uniref:Mannosyltransferase n=1 Tax=Cudoniella acicularis TaxID=354080 RepID=A0A8H4W1P3_9HELO|nr:hypothetical protein G7Y89_g7814 [Cudoniella acicularis]